MKRKQPSNVTRVRKTQEKQRMGPHTERSTDNEKRNGEEKAEERMGNNTRQTEQEKPKQAHMEVMVEFEFLQAGQQC